MEDPERPRQTGLFRQEHEDIMKIYIKNISKSSLEMIQY